MLLAVLSGKEFNKCWNKNILLVVVVKTALGFLGFSSLFEKDLILLIMPHIALGNRKAYYPIYFILIVIWKSRLVNYPCKIVGVILQLPAWLSFPILNVIKQPMIPNRQCQTIGNSVCLATSEPGSLSHFSGKIMQFRAELSLKLLWMWW